MLRWVDFVYGCTHERLDELNGYVGWLGMCLGCWMDSWLDWVNGWMVA